MNAYKSLFIIAILLITSSIQNMYSIGLTQLKKRAEARDTVTKSLPFFMRDLLVADDNEEELDAETRALLEALIASDEEASKN